ncbi:MAG: hypothetical protein B6229_06200 [Spirochaetaceae bacterium 4572_7]|nr:MAG: hypothetical protein B6229_06200 [Spirochaetaceae bacterium 4572_7]
MISLKRKKTFLNIEEIFYYEGASIESKADIVLLKQSKNSFNKGNKFITLHIDLKQDLESIEAEFKKNTKYEIRRATNKDNLEFKYDDSSVLTNYKEFIEFYDKFAESKGLQACNKKLIGRLIKENSLIVTYVEGKDSFLVIHYYITDGNRARLLYSASQFRNVPDNNTRNLIGRGNRFLHREDIVYFKQNGYSILDLGGIAENEDNQETSQIDSFKKSFGGKRIVEYNCKIGKTILGKIALGLKL